MRFEAVRERSGALQRCRESLGVRHHEHLGASGCFGHELGERVEQFARQYTDKLTVIDPAEADLADMPQAFRALISPIILATELERLSAHIEHLRNHPLTTRRYYKRVAY